MADKVNTDANEIQIEKLYVKTLYVQKVVDEEEAQSEPIRLNIDKKSSTSQSTRRFSIPTKNNESDGKSSLFGSLRSRVSLPDIPHSRKNSNSSGSSRSSTSDSDTPADWGSVTSLMFDRSGQMVVICENGNVYQGAPPKTKQISGGAWLNKAELKGKGGWEQLQFSCIDHKNRLWGLRGNVKYTGKVPENSEPFDNWTHNSHINQTVDWENTQLMFLDREAGLFATSSMWEGLLMYSPKPLELDEEWRFKVKRIGPLQWDRASHLLCHPSGVIYKIEEFELMQLPRIDFDSVVPQTENIISGLERMDAWVDLQHGKIVATNLPVFKTIAFHPNGDLYGITMEGEMWIKSNLWPFYD